MGGLHQLEFRAGVIGVRSAFGSNARRLATATAARVITLQKPTPISGADQAWFDRLYDPRSQAFRGRVLFST